MVKKRKIFKWLIVILSLFGIQTLTYFTIGPRLLKTKLLSGDFPTRAHQSDSIFVCDFYVADSHSCLNDVKIYGSHNLSADKEFIKEKFNVDFVYFDSQARHQPDTIEKAFNLKYYTWTARYDWITLFGLYGMRQTEALTTKKYLCTREVAYHWFLFYWVPTFEWFEVTNLK